MGCSYSLPLPAAPVAQRPTGSTRFDRTETEMEQVAEQVSQCTPTHSFATTVYTLVQSWPETPRQTVWFGMRFSHCSSIDASLTSASWKVDTPYLVATCRMRVTGQGGWMVGWLDERTGKGACWELADSRDELDVSSASVREMQVGG